MGLKQKIQEIESAYSHHLDLVRRDTILELLSEVTKQIQEMMVVADLEHTHPSPEFWKGWNKAIERVLTVLDGEKENPKTS